MPDGLSRTEKLRFVRATRAKQIREERIRCEGSLIEFMIRAWPEIEADPLELNWHHKVITSYLEDITWGRLRTLIINIPPRHTKSLIVSVMWPAWIWAQPEERWNPLAGPHVNFLAVSYAAKLSEKIALQMLRLVTGEWYQRLWGDRVKIRSDQESRADFANERGGARRSCSIEGGILGEGAPIQIIDDPHSTAPRRGVESEAMRLSTLDGMRQLATRITDPRISSRVLIMQRVHVNDATNYAVENWEPKPRWLMLPAEFAERRADPDDIRTEEGELLWPKLWTAATLANERKELTPYHYAAQFQQEPVAAGGNIILREWWRLWPQDGLEVAGIEAAYRCGVCRWVGYLPRCIEDTADCPNCGSVATREIPYPAFSFRLLSVDTNFGDKDENSWSAASCWEIWHGKDDAPRVMLTYAWRGRPHLHATKDDLAAGRLGLVERIHKIAVERKSDVVLIEKKTRGQDLYDELARQSTEWPYRLEWFNPQGRSGGPYATDAKANRLHAVSGLFTADLVWAPNTAWAETVITEVCEAPHARFSDLADTCSQAMLYLRQSGMLTTTEEHTREARRSRVFRGNRAPISAEIEGM